MSRTDVEMVLATQVAYLNIKEGENVGEAVNMILENYGTYDASSGTYVFREGLNSESLEGSQFATALYIQQLGQEHNCNSWQFWTIADRCDRNDSSGMYACLIDTNDGDAIIGFRGSESYDDLQKSLDWVDADFGRVNNTATQQQIDATDYMQYLSDHYGDQYHQFDVTGHSLGGSLAINAAVTASPELQDKINEVISFDGPGFSDEYIQAHEAGIERMNGKLKHYEWSLVGSLLYQLPGTDNHIISAHNDTEVVFLESALFRHHTRNIEYDENGNIIDGEPGILQQITGPLSRILDQPGYALSVLLSSSFLTALFSSVPGFAQLQSALALSSELVANIVESISNRIDQLYQSYIFSKTSGNYSVQLQALSQISEEFGHAIAEITAINNEICEIKQCLPYDSTSAYYFKRCLGRTHSNIRSQIGKMEKMQHTLETSVQGYNKGDHLAAAKF